MYLKNTQHLEIRAQSIIVKNDKNKKQKQKTK